MESYANPLDRFDVTVWRKHVRAQIAKLPTDQKEVVFMANRPLSPIAEFPAAALVWDLNYRGDLAMLWQARAHEGLVVHDGWQLFCHGWAAALAPILDLSNEVDTASRFAMLAGLRPREWCTTCP